MMANINPTTHDFAPAWLKLPASSTSTSTCTSSTLTSSTNNHPNCISNNIINNQSNNELNTRPCSSSSPHEIDHVSQHLQATTSNPRRYSNSFNRKDNSKNTNNYESYSNQHQHQRANANNHKHPTSNYLNSRFSHNNSFADEDHHQHASVSSSGHQPHHNIGNNNINVINGGSKLACEDESDLFTPHFLKEEFNAKEKAHQLMLQQQQQAKLNYRNGDSMGRKGEKNEKTEGNSFNQEFPSLINLGANTGNSKMESAWTNTANNQKVLGTIKNMKLVERSSSEFNNHNQQDNQMKSNEASGIAYNLASKAANNNVKMIRTNFIMSKTKLINGNAAVKENGNGFGSVYNKMPLFITKSNSQFAPAMEVLGRNKMLSKRKSDKSDFLNAFRNNDSKEKELVLMNGVNSEDKGKKNDLSGFDAENNYENSSIESSGDGDALMNVVDSVRGTSTAITTTGALDGSGDDDVRSDLAVDETTLYQQDQEDFNLSRSMEAEYRLLLELGWKDEKEVQPLTEEEMKEAKDLITARNGFKQTSHSPRKSVTTSTSSCSSPVSVSGTLSASHGSHSPFSGNNNNSNIIKNVKNGRNHVMPHVYNNFDDDSSSSSDEDDLN